jgi:hypothetical protein
MPENTELAKSNPISVVDAYDAKAGKYQGAPVEASRGPGSPTSTISPRPETKQPLK